MPTSSNNALVQKIVDYIGYSDAAMTKAAAVLAERDEQAEKLAHLIPEAVKACVEHERIEPHQKEALAKALANPVQAMELVIKLAAHRNAADWRSTNSDATCRFNDARSVLANARNASRCPAVSV